MFEEQTEVELLEELFSRFSTAELDAIVKKVVQQSPRTQNFNELLKTIAQIKLPNTVNSSFSKKNLQNLNQLIYS